MLWKIDIVGEGGKHAWIAFKYERLPNLCYWCGRITRDDKDCELWIDNKGTLKVEQHEFGPQLRAPPFVATKKNMVPGYYAVKKKEGSGASADRVSGRNSILGRGKLPE